MAGLRCPRWVLSQWRVGGGSPSHFTRLGTTQYGRYYDFTFLPLGFVGRLLTRLLHVNGSACRLIWMHGLLLEWHGQMALLSYSPEEVQLKYRTRITNYGLFSVAHPSGRVLVSVTGGSVEKGRRHMLSFMIEAIESILGSYPSLGAFVR